MSRFKLFDRIREGIGNIYDRWNYQYHRILGRDHIAVNDIGVSKEYGLLDFKSDLNDPSYWTAQGFSGPETGGEQIYGTNETAEEWINGTGGRAKRVANWISNNIPLIGGPVSDAIKQNAIDARRARELRGPTSRNLDNSSAHYPSTFPAPSFNVREARPAINSATRIQDEEELGSSDLEDVSTTGVQTFSKTRFEYDPGRKPYIIKPSVVPSWFSETEKNPTRNKSKVGPTGDLGEVNLMSDWASDDPKKTYLADNSPHYEFATRFEREKVPSIKRRSVGGKVPIVNPFSVETSLPRDEIAILFYQTMLKENGAPGGQTVQDLKYNKAYEEALGLIPFCITTLTPDHRTYLNFQANLESYSDNYNGDWDAIQYVGRAEKFWGYTGFSRNIDISFKIAIARKEDCEEMYHRLNRLVGATAPSYGPSGLFMRGTLASLTIGDLLKHKDGIINSVKISWQTDYPWEVRESERSNIAAGPFMVPHVLDVSLQFTPIEEKTVTEDNGDYFVFRTNPPVKQEGKQAVKKEKEREPSTGLQLPKVEFNPKIETEVKQQIDNTSFAGNVMNIENSRNGAIRGNSNPMSVYQRQAEGAQKTPEAVAIEEAIFGKQEVPSITARSGER